MRRVLLTSCVAVAAAAVVAGCTSSKSATTSSSPAPSTAVTSATPAASTPATPGTVLTTTVTLPNGAVRRQILVPWDRPADQDLQVAAAGLSLTSAETLQVHYHAHLDVIVYGVAVAVPAGLGINVGPNNTAPPHGSPGIAPLHTHDTSGILHIEAPAQAEFTLGQVFDEWGIVLGPAQAGAYRTGDGFGDTVRVYVNGTAYGADPAGIVLKAHEEIAVVVTAAGKPTVTPPSSYSFPAGD